MIDCLFVNPNISNECYQNLSLSISAKEPPTWSLLLAESCRSKGYNVEILDCDAERLNEDISIRRITDSNARIICFINYGANPNASTQSMEATFRLANKLKSVINTFITISIGSHTSALPLEVLSEPGIDFVAINEGVYTLHDLLQVTNFYDKTQLEKVRGLGWKNYGYDLKSKDFLVLNNNAQIVPQSRLDIDLPGMAWDLLPYKNSFLDLYRCHVWHNNYDPYTRSPFASLYTSLGCVKKCSFCLEQNTNIVLSRNGNKKIKDIIVGDKLIAWDENKLQLVETEVIKTVSLTTNQIFKIKTNDGKEILATSEHPFYVEGLWINADKLRVGNKLLVIDSSDKMSFRMKTINPMFNSEIQNKVSITQKTNYKSGKNIPYLCTEKGKKTISVIAKERMLSDNNPMLNLINQKKASNRMTGEQNPKWNNGASIKLKPYYLNKNKSIRKKIKIRDNYTCQECGKTKTESKIDAHHIDYNKYNNNESNLITLCASCHTRTNFDRDIWQKRYTQLMLDKYNTCPHYVVIESIEKLNGEWIVYNIECDKFNNFFANYILTHNCMINIVNRTNIADNVDASFSPIMRYFSTDWVKKQLEYLTSRGVKNIRFADELFFLNRKHYEPILDSIIEKQQDINWWAYSRIDTIKDQFLLKFQKAGCNYLALGIEAASQKIRQEIDKGRFEEIDIRDIVKKIKNAGINSGNNFIFGFPNEKLENLQETLDLSIELEGDFNNYYAAVALPGSPLYFEAKKNGWELPSTLDGYGFLAYNHLPLRTHHLSAAEVLKFRDEAWHKYFESESFLNRTEQKFGLVSRQYIEEITKIKLKRKILGD